MYKIYTIANKKEEKFLRRKTSIFDFSKFTRKELESLIKEMKKFMEQRNGVGLSANQIGLDLQLFIAKVPRKNEAPKLYAIFNPKISEVSKEKIILEEGCLSVPGIYGDVERSEQITLEGIDKNQKNIKIKARGLTARIFQHEVDHLNGILFTDKASNLHNARQTPLTELSN